MDLADLVLFDGAVFSEETNVTQQREGGRIHWRTIKETRVVVTWPDGGRYTGPWKREVLYAPEK